MTMQSLMKERFGHDSVIALATLDDGRPSVRYVNAYYEDGAFYVITHARSAKMQQIARSPRVALAGDWFTGHGMAESLGAFASAANGVLAQTLQRVFAGWINNGHSDLSSSDTIILRITLTDGVAYAHGARCEWQSCD